MSLKTYYVVSPEYETYSHNYVDPPEYGCDCIMIEAENKRDAIILGVREILRTKKKSYAQDNKDSDQPPWAGYKAEEVLESNVLKELEESQ